MERNAQIKQEIDVTTSRMSTSQRREWADRSRRRECGGAADVVQIAAAEGYHTAGVKWNVLIGNICGGCWQQH